MMKKEGGKIENQNEQDFIEGAGDLSLFIHGDTKEDLRTKCAAKFPTTILCCLCYVAMYYILSTLPAAFISLSYMHLTPSESTHLSRYSCNPGQALSGGGKSIPGWRQGGRRGGGDGSRSKSSRR